MVAPVGADDVRRGAPRRLRGVLGAAVAAPRRGPLDRPGRRGRLRAEPAVERGGRRVHPPRDRDRPATGPARTWRSRSIPAVELDPRRGHRRHDTPGRYRLETEKRTLDTDELIDLWASWLDRYPIVSLEDGIGEVDWAGWRALTARLGSRVQLVGDDLFVTNTAFIERGIAEGSRERGPDQAQPDRHADRDDRGDRAWPAARAGRAMVSHRSGETEDTTIADLVVALGTGQIKSGAPSRSERVAKYNRLLRIEEELGGATRATRAGRRSRRARRGGASR